MPTIFDLLENVERRPYMYLGGSGPKDLLIGLELFLSGYEAAISHHSVDDAPGKQFMREFGEYLSAKYDWSMSCGPIAAIRDAAANDEDAWKMFWKLVNEYRRSRGF